MRKRFLIVSIGAWLILLAGAAMVISRQAHAEVATTSISVGFNATLHADAGQYLAIPTCSIAAKCLAQLELCNTLANGTADSTHCVFISANGQSPYSTNLWMGVSQKTTTGTSISTEPYGFGSINVSVPNYEINIVP